MSTLLLRIGEAHFCFTAIYPTVSNPLPRKLNAFPNYQLTFYAIINENMDIVIDLSLLLANQLHANNLTDYFFSSRP